MYLTMKEITAKLKYMAIAKVAKETGVSRNTIINARSGKVINYEAGRKLAEFLTEQSK
jgi:DNA-directed RNA polymerase specialized sigma54-like protein